MKPIATLLALFALSIVSVRSLNAVSVPLAAPASRLAGATVVPQCPPVCVDENCDCFRFCWPDGSSCICSYEAICQ